MVNSSMTSECSTKKTRRVKMVRSENSPRCNHTHDDIDQELVSYLEFTSKELVAYGKDDTKERFDRRMTLGRPRVKDAKVDFSNGNAIIVLVINKHDVTIEVEDIIGLVADEIIEQYGYKVKRNDIVRLTKVAVRLLLEESDIRVDCDCEDYKYRFNWIAKEYGYALRDRIQGHDYPPNITNPMYKGALCKHLFLALNRVSAWSDSASRRLINDILGYDRFLQLFDLDDTTPEEVDRYVNDDLSDEEELLEPGHRTRGETTPDDTDESDSQDDEVEEDDEDEKS